MKKYIAEFIGTAILVLFGCGSAVAANALFSAMGMLPAAFTTLTIAVAFGLAVTAAVYAVGHVSGAHVNPAVSLAMLISKRMEAKDFVGYVVAQIIGACAAAGILAFIFGGTTSLGANGYGAASTFGISLSVAVVLEAVLTFAFVLVVLNVTERAENKGNAGIIIGLALTMVHIMGVPFTGTSVNPARSLGPALVQALSDTTALQQVWVFIVAPLVGAAIAAAVYMLLKGEDEEALEDEEAVDIPLDFLTKEEIEVINGIAAESGVEINAINELATEAETEAEAVAETEAEAVAETEAAAEVEAEEETIPEIHPSER